MMMILLDLFLLQLMYVECDTPLRGLQQENVLQDLIDFNKDFMIFRKISIMKYTITIGVSKISDIIFPRTSSWMAYVQGFKLNLL